jgi:hypothetical protein
MNERKHILQKHPAVKHELTIYLLKETLKILRNFTVV